MAEDNNNPVNPFAEFNVSAGSNNNQPVDNPFAKKEEKPVVENKVEEEKSVEEVKNAVEAEVVEVEPDLGASDGDENFSDEVWGALGQAGITRGTIFSFLFVLVLIFVVLGFVFFGGDDGAEEPSVGGEVRVEESDDSDVVEEETVVIENVGREQSAPGLVTAYTFGQEFRPIEVVPVTYYGNSAGLLSASIFGLDNGVSEDLLAADLLLIEEMENAYTTDIYLLLNQSTSRRETLDAHIAKLEELEARGNAALLTIRDDLVFLEEEFDLLDEQKDRVEVLYFDSLDVNESGLAFDYYEQFVSFSQRMIAVRAEFKAKDYVRARYERVMVFLSPRLRDIKSNYEALIKGVRVFDIENSDIDAIIPL